MATDGTSLSIENADGRTTLTNSLGQTTTYDISGTPLRLDTLTNPNGNATTFGYDDFGHVTSIAGPDGGALHLHV